MTDRAAKRRLEKALKIKPRVNAGPINSLWLAGCASAGAVAAIAPDSNSHPFDWLLSGLIAAAGASAVIRAVRLMARDFQTRRDIALANINTGSHGEAREATLEEREAAGMNTPINGEFYGLDKNGNKVCRPSHAPFAWLEGPPGTGKTVCWVLESVLNRAFKGYSVAVPCIKGEVSYMLAPVLRAHGFEVWCINPAETFLNILGNVEVNPYQAFLDAAYADDYERKHAVRIANDLARQTLPLGQDDKNPYFVFGGQRGLLTGKFGTGLFDPSTCTPTGVYELLGDSERFLRRCHALQSFESSLKDDPIVRVAQLEARNMIARHAENAEHYYTFLENASQRLIPFNPAGTLGNFGANAIHNLRDLRKRQVIVFLVMPVENLQEYALLIELLLYTIVNACKSIPNGRPVHIVGEEALNFRLDTLLSDMNTMRGLRLTFDLYAQNYFGLEALYGKTKAAAILSNCDVQLYTGLNSYERARHVSDLLAQTTIKKQDQSYSTSPSDMNLNSSEMPRPLMSADEILAMPRHTAWKFAKGVRPTLIDMLTYAEVWPQRELIGINPTTGTRLGGRERARLDYGDLRAKR